MNRQHFISIASYEAKILSREWSFRFMAGLAIISVTLLQVFTQSDFIHPKWASISLVSSIPYANAYLTNYIQVFITIFLAGRFLFQRKNSETTDAIRVRPYNKSEYLWGKVTGFILVMVVLDGFLMLIAILIHLFASASPWGFYPYLFYFFTLTLPILLFTTGFTVIVKSLIKQQALSLLILCVLFLLEINYGMKLLHGNFDIFASTLPNTFSEWTGFSGLERYLTQRVVFPLAGIGLLFLSIQLLPRLINKQKIRYKLQIIGIIFLAASIIPVRSYQSSFSREQAARDAARQLFAKYEKQLKVEIKEHNILFQQTGKTFSATSHLLLKNPHETALSSVILYLNPGLTVEGILFENTPTDFQREGQIIAIEHTLQPGEEQTIRIRYHGKLTQDICYAEYKCPEDFPASRNYSFFNYGKEMFFLQDNFTLLTPEIIWYPTSTAPVNVLSPYSTNKTFTKFRLNVIGEKERIVISQGYTQKRQDTICFSNTQKLTGISLCMGKYTQLTDTVDNICTELYLFREHKSLFENVETENLKEYLRNTLNPTPLFPWLKVEKYPLQKLAFIETPIHFCAYSRYWQDATEQIQPELVFRPELEATEDKNPAFDPDSPRYKDLNPEETAQSKWLDSYKMNTLDNGRSPFNRNLFFEFLNIKTRSEYLKNETKLSLLWESDAPYIHSPEFPAIGMILDILPDISSDVLNQYSNFSIAPVYIDHLQQHNLASTFRNDQFYKIIPKLIPCKTGELIKQLSFIFPFKSFEDFLVRFKETHSFESVRFEQFCQEYQEESGINILPTIREWFYATGVPSFRVRDVKLYSTKNDRGEEMVLSTFKIWNKSPNDGIISVTLNDAGVKHYQIPARGVKEIRTLFHKAEEMTFKISSDLSQNIPGSYKFVNIPITASITTPNSGMFDTDTTAFTPPQGEHIVDDDSEGFRVIDKSKLKKLLTEESFLREKTAGPSPKEWTRYIHPQAYGEPIKSYYCRLAGKGETKIEWGLQLPETGEYELFTFINYDFFDYCEQASFHRPPSNPSDQAAAPTVITQTYTFTHQEGEAKITIEINDSCNGWVSLGKYKFTEGIAKVILTDSGTYPEQNLYADAIKWVRTK